MRNIFALAVIVPITLIGCASGSGGLAANYVSPLQFQAYSCEQIDAELGRLYVRINQLGGRLDDAAAHDRWLAAGSRLFWPSLFMLGGTKEQGAEFSRLKGEYEALDLLAMEKQCELGNGNAPSGNEVVLQNSSTTRKSNFPGAYPSYTLLPSGAVVADSPTVMTGAPSIPVRTISIAAIFKKTRGDVCDKYVSGGDYCWWSPPGNYSMCPPIASFGECKALYGGGCQLGHGKVLPLC
ncbi:MAG: hypothetical protein NT159_13830 [Proteobacteria bacterium]|nr:hypothetical protein [Pseudomonadota bacterium]